MAEQRSDVNGNQEPEGRARQIQDELDTRRRSISQTLGEMKTTMTSEVNKVKDQARSTFDVRTQMHRYPIAVAIGALALGFYAGRSLGGRAFEEDENEFDFPGGIHTGAGESYMPAHDRRPLISPSVRHRVSSRVEGALSEVTDTFLSELVRIGRDVLVPRLVGSLQQKIDSKTNFQQTSKTVGGQDYVGGNPGSMNRF